MKMNNIFYAISITLFVLSCSSNSTDDVTSQPDPNPTTEITYDDNIRNIMTSKCTNCHGNPTTNNAPFSLTTFSNVSSRINSILDRINRTGSGVMPISGQMPLETRQLIQQWKDDGLLEN